MDRRGSLFPAIVLILIGGYFLLQVSGLDEAVEIARQCPALEHGLTVEVRPVAEQCSIMQRMGMEYAHAPAKT